MPSLEKQVTIIIVSYKSKNKLISILKSIPKKIKVIIIENSYDYELKKLFEKHVDLSAQFTQFILSDVYVENKVLNVDYYCLIPYTAKTKTQHAITEENQKYYPKNLQKILRVL